MRGWPQFKKNRQNDRIQWCLVRFLLLTATDQPLFTTEVHNTKRWRRVTICGYLASFETNKIFCSPVPLARVVGQSQSVKFRLNDWPKRQWRCAQWNLIFYSNATKIYDNFERGALYPNANSYCVCWAKNHPKFHLGVPTKNWSASLFRAKNRCERRSWSRYLNIPYKKRRA